MASNDKLSSLLHKDSGSNTGTNYKDKSSSKNVADNFYYNNYLDVAKNEYSSRKNENKAFKLSKELNNDFFSTQKNDSIQSKFNKIREKSKDRVLDQFFSEATNISSSSKINKNDIHNKVTKYYKLNQNNSPKRNQGINYGSDLRSRNTFGTANKENFK